MTNQGKISRKWFIAVIGLVLVAAVVASGYVYRVQQHRETIERQALASEGIAQFRNEQYEKSLQTLRRIPEDSNKDWRVPYYIGSALIQLKQYELAVVQLEKAHSLNTNDQNIPFALGVTYYKLGNLSLSKAYFSTVLKIDPTNDEAKGLMDIMANLERNQPAADPQEINQESDSGGDSH